MIEEDPIIQDNSVVHDEGVPVELFTYVEIQKLLSSCSNGKSPIIDGGRYKNIKNNKKNMVRTLLNYLIPF